MKKLIQKEKKNIIIGLISVIGLIIGSIIIGFIPTFLIILFIDTMILLFTKNSKKTNKKDRWQSFLIVCFCCVICVLCLTLAFSIYIAISSPGFTSQKLYNKEATVLYDKNGVEFAKLGTEERKTITYDQLSESLIDAIIATEDSRFFQHSGVDLARFLKASASQALGRGGGGASTLTMQVVKNTFTSTESSGIKGIIRKFTDIYMAVFKVEPNYTKEEILEFYANSNCMGGNIYGVEQASLAYFGKSASELNVAEAAMIAGLFQAPNAYNPYLHPEECEQRRKTVLALMLRHGYIDKTEYDMALELTVDKLLVSTEDTVSNEYQAFIDTLADEVLSRTGQDIYSNSMQIYTTLDQDMQKQIDSIMSGATFAWKNELVQGGSVILDVKNGAINAVLAGHNRNAGDWNFATMNKRQIGSTAKPLYDYGPGIEYNNWSTVKVFTDEPYAYSDGVSVRNFDSSYKGYITMHDALKGSRNISALKAFQQLKNSDIKNFATNLGLSPEIDGGMIYETHSIGGYDGESPLTVAAAYAAFANGGYYNEPHTFTRLIVNENGEEYTVKPTTKRVMSEATAYMITTILEDTAGYAVGVSVNGVNYCAKTGTTDLSREDKAANGLPNNAIRDKWIASYNDSYAIALWYGYKNLDKEAYLTGGDNYKTLFQGIAKAAYTKNSEWTMPDSVVEMEVETGLDEVMLPSEYTPDDLKITGYFKKGFEPTETSERFSQLPNVTNLKYDEAKRVLTWDAIETPKYLNSESINTMASNLFTDEEYKNSYINNFNNYNSSHVGNVIYNIYKKDASGLTLIGSTSDNYYSCTAIGNTTYVVKTSYSVLTSNISTGAELTVSSKLAIITSSLNSKSIIELNIGDTYKEPEKPVIVLENALNDVTDKAEISVVVKKASNNQIYNSTVYINTLSAETYTITYNISYNGYTDTVTKTVKIK